MGAWGSTGPSDALLPPLTGYGWDAAVYPDDLRAGDRIRLSWIFRRNLDPAEHWPEVEVYYAHLDRFLLAATVGCNQTSRGMAVDPTGVQPAEGAFPPLQ